MLTVGDWLEIWLTIRAHVRDKTLRGYLAHVRLHLVPHVGQVLPAELDVAHLDRAFTELDGGPMSPDYLTQPFTQLVQASGLPPVRLHDLSVMSVPAPP